VGFNTSGFHRVRLKATDAEGLSDVATVLVDVRPAGSESAPLLIAYFPEDVVRANTPVGFSAFTADADDDPVTVAWDLDGDGAFDDATGLSVSHTYATAGSYTVRARASDGRGGTRTQSATVTVVGDAGLAPAISLNFPVLVRAGEPTTFWANAV